MSSPTRSAFPTSLSGIPLSPTTAGQGSFVLPTSPLFGTSSGFPGTGIPDSPPKWNHMRCMYWKTSLIYRYSCLGTVWFGIIAVNRIFIAPTAFSFSPTICFKLGSLAGSPYSILGNEKGSNLVINRRMRMKQFCGFWVIVEEKEIWLELQLQIIVAAPWQTKGTLGFFQSVT